MLMFREPLALKVVAGEKTVTRRVPNDNPRSPWWRERCGMVVGSTHAVCPGRGVLSIGRVRIASTRMVRLGLMTEDEARREGCESLAHFISVWEAINREYDPQMRVWRVEFQPVRDAQDAA